MKTEGKLSASKTEFSLTNATVDFMNFLPHPLNDKDNYILDPQKVGEEWVLLTLSVFIMLQVF